jgi:hypothetical protein
MSFLKTNVRPEKKLVYAVFKITVYTPKESSKLTWLEIANGAKCGN